MKQEIKTKKKKKKSLSHVQLFVTPWTVAHQAPPSMGFSRQEYWSALPFPSPGNLPDPGIEPRSPTLQADALTSQPPGKQAAHRFVSVNRVSVSSIRKNFQINCLPLGGITLWKTVFFIWLTSRLMIKRQRSPASYKFSFMWKCSLIDIKGT